MGAIAAFPGVAWAAFEVSGLFRGRYPVAPCPSVVQQDGTRVMYRVENEHARQLVTDGIFQAEHALGGTPAHHRAERKSA